MSIKSARIHFNEHGTPVADDFDDVYFSNASGLDETRHVFLMHNGLPQRFRDHRGAFVIAETGFGTGLNFLTTWQAHRAEAGPNCRLHFISFEKFPLARADLAKALAAWPELAELSEALIDQYPPLVPGCHRLLFDGGRVTLDLWLCDVAEGTAQLHCPQGGLVDAWYLDGFAPAKNPDMWSQALFDAMGRLARADASFATFTAAGFVRRGLIAAGFAAEKVKGFGHKREMLRGDFTGTPSAGSLPPWSHRARAGDLSDVAIIGGGLAGAASAWQLSRRGLASTLYCADPKPGLRASGNRQGVLYPLLNRDHDNLSQFFTACYLYALNRLKEMDIPKGLDGVLQLAVDDKLAERYRDIAAKGPFPTELLRWLEPDEASELAGVSLPYPALHYPKAGWLQPPALVRSLLEASQVDCRYGIQITGLKRDGEHWQLLSGDKVIGRHQTVILAAGSGLLDMEQLKGLPMSAVRGQVSQVKAEQGLDQLKQVLCYKGYMAPGWDGSLCLGASFVRQDRGEDVREEEDQENWQKLSRTFPDADWLPEQPEKVGAKAGIRVVLRDHLPLIGQVPQLEGHLAYDGFAARDPAALPRQPVLPDLWLLGGLGARGVTSGLLAADILVSQMAGEPQPVPDALLEALSPNRFWLRRLKKGQAPC
ncbi:bifunctional tRNA (5-methylaminomethyl-2-thiouridine)(34)-methyltransferase MnmD/FAD-dependent 5-carboxymethylaminomethyl-2-thiouridine(34) oxidoreductase MnmC [Gallaecimonas sp. GXIMD4217]|uniref:bifunctional tRNA (5-methylaminomethyl-2-thiouridine)(34)-methyltransferase MnmD/FAD-dependent 5-carboxymethylaminomethyl-2-thiouridine(34) oxidoreductase MnmC n=1 Tax=Gallaecimonas sp. GXIMD4217 TaxID=3131927 RepID=UPI00311AF247